MANELIIRTGNTINAVAGASNAIADGAFNNAADKGSVTNSAVGDYPNLKAELRMTFNGTGTLDDNAEVHLYFRRDGIGGATQAPQPDADYKHDYQGPFKVDKNNATTEQVLTIEGIAAPVGEDFEVWIEVDTGKGCASGWDLDFVPYTYAPS